MYYLVLNEYQYYRYFVDFSCYGYCVIIINGPIYSLDTCPKNSHIKCEEGVSSLAWEKEEKDLVMNSIFNDCCVPVQPPCYGQKAVSKTATSQASVTLNAPAAETDLSKAREHLVARASYLHMEKSRDAMKAFFIRDDEAPGNLPELVKRIKDGLFVIPKKYADEDKDDCFSHHDLVWRDPSKPADKEGYAKAEKAIDEAFANTLDIIKVMPEKDGLEALNAFKSATFH